MFSFGIASKTGPNDEVMENSRISLTLIGYGSTSIQSTTNSNEIKHGARKTIVKVIFLLFKFDCKELMFLFMYYSLKQKILVTGSLAKQLY